MVRRVAPEIAEIVDTTDHTAGTKPFYPRTESLRAARREEPDAESIG